MRRWKTLLIVVAVMATALTVAAVALAKGSAPGTGTRGGACGALMSNPKAWKAMQELRTEHIRDMQTWRDKYSADPSSAAAVQALEQLRQEHWNDMRALLKKFGIKTPQGAGPGMMGAGGCAGAGGCGGPGAGLGAGQSTGMMGGGGMMGSASY